MNSEQNLTKLEVELLTFRKPCDCSADTEAGTAKQNSSALEQNGVRVSEKEMGDKVLS